MAFGILENKSLKEVPGMSKRRAAVIGISWNGSGIPYTQTLNIADVKANSVVEISLPNGADATQVEAFGALKLQDGGQTDGSITLKCFGTINAVEIPISIIVRGDL